MFLDLLGPDRQLGDPLEGIDQVQPFGQLFAGEPAEEGGHTDVAGVDGAEPARGGDADRDEHQHDADAASGAWRQLDRSGHVRCPFVVVHLRRVWHAVRPSSAHAPHARRRSNQDETLPPLRAWGSLESPQDMAMNFGSDNVSGVHDAILDALREANAGTAAAYGHDEWTARADARLRDVFECDLSAYLVVTGTAANALALAACCPPHGAVVCHHEAHITTDECGAPEMFTGGAKLLGVRGPGRQADAAEVSGLLSTLGRGEHEQRPSVLSLSQATELGTVYTTAEVAALAELARAHRMHLHMDGARFANALVRLGCTPAELTWKSGVDVLSFGATKNGALGVEAVVSSTARSPTTSSTGVSGPGSWCRRAATWARSCWPTSTTISGWPTPGTPTPWPIGWPTVCARSRRAPAATGRGQRGVRDRAADVHEALRAGGAAIRMARRRSRHRCRRRRRGVHPSADVVPIADAEVQTFLEAAARREGSALLRDSSAGRRAPTAASRQSRPSAASDRRWRQHPRPLPGRRARARRRGPSPR